MTDDDNAIFFVICFFVTGNNTHEQSAITQVCVAKVRVRVQKIRVGDGDDNVMCRIMNVMTIHIYTIAQFHKFIISVFAI